MTQSAQLASALILYGATGCIILFLVLSVARLFSARNPTAEKESTYECGEDPLVDLDDVSFPVNYYAYALLFLVFDIEVVFLIPWALVFPRYGWIGLLEVVIFLVILLTGLGVAWARGALSWD